jgi:uncharacterized protein (DUF433 family)
MRRQALYSWCPDLVSLILDLLASSMSETEIIAEYPGLKREDILAAIAYGAEAAREQLIPSE